MTNYQKLQKVLTELFELDKAELDFGIYRIMNQKREDVLDFLDKKLPTEVREILQSHQKRDTTALKKNLDDAIKMAKEFGLDPDTTPKVQEARTLYETAGSITALEQEVFSHLASFFKRYYQDGDFISLRRYKKDVYAIPYEGEEVKLHWANQDQYYIKTSENLKNYAFKIDGDKTIKFTLKEANTEQNNNKTQKDQERRFALYEEEPITIEGDTLHLNFTYEPHKKTVKQDKLLEDAVAVLTTKVPKDFAKIFSLAPTEKNKKRTLLEKHLNDFSARNTFDYFIHKDLGGFLSRELDFYIKNEVLFIDDINTDNEQAFTTQLSKIRALKQVAQKIISFLAQIENFQKKLWLKKKFVISSDYCITLDRIPETYYAEIAENKEQLKEWKALFNVTVKNEVGLKEEPFLVLDTKFFDQEFKDKLLAEFDDLDEQTNGVLINSENFQALKFIQNRFTQKVDTIYIDPPYNTSASEIAYKNNYKHSSWLSLIQNRLVTSRPLMTENGIHCSTIDDVEVKEFHMLLEQEFGRTNVAGIVPIKINPSGRPTEKGFALSHEYAIFTTNSRDSKIYKIPRTEKQLARFNEKDKDGIFEYRNLRREGSNSDRENGQRQFYPIFANLNKGTIRVPKMEWLEDDREWKLKEKALENEVIIYPINDGGREKNWRWSEESLRNDYSQFLARIPNYGTPQVYYKYRPNLDGTTPLTLWTDAKYSATEHGTKVLKDLFKEPQFSYPKSIYAVMECLSVMGNKDSQQVILDYFAGSGTTGHAAIKLNRDDEGNRKFLLVEMGEYFKTTTKPRIQKVIYSDNWNNGKPEDKKGISQMFKYFNLESYEDALNNLQINPTDKQQQLLTTNEDVQKEYLLNYMLDVESREHLMNVEAFKNPFNYKLKVTENNELIPTTVDLVETFNYLIGLHVKRMQRTGAFKTVEGVTNGGEKVLVIWRNLEESDNEDLDKFVKKMDYNLRDGEFDTIYVNGDNNLANLKKEEERWKVLLLEEVFFTEMFDVKDV